MRAPLLVDDTRPIDDTRPSARHDPRRRLLFDLFGLVLVGAMVAALVGLVRYHAVGFGELSLAVTTDELAEGFREGFAYHGVYMGEQKVGTLYTEQRRRGDGYGMRSEMTLEVAAGPLTGRSETSLDVALDASFKLQSFKLTLDGSALTAQAEGRWRGDGMMVTVRLGDGEPQTRLVEMPEPPPLLTSLRAALVRRGLAEGERVTTRYFDPMTQRPVDADITYRGAQQLELMGQMLEAHLFEQVFMGQRSRVYVNDLGETLLEELPLGMVVVREPKLDAGAALTPSASPAGEGAGEGADDSGGEGARGAPSSDHLDGLLRMFGGQAP